MFLGADLPITDTFIVSAALQVVPMELFLLQVFPQSNMYVPKVGKSQWFYPPPLHYNHTNRAKSALPIHGPHLWVPWAMNPTKHRWKHPSKKTVSKHLQPLFCCYPLNNSSVTTISTAFTLCSCHKWHRGELRDMTWCALVRGMMSHFIYRSCVCSL